MDCACFFKIFLLLIFCSNAVLCKNRSKVFISSYIKIENIKSNTDTYDYHEIQFYQNSLQFDLNTEITYFSTNKEKALFRIGDDNATYPQKAKGAISILQSDIPGSNTSSPNINYLERLLPSMDMFHRKCYVAWDITRNEIVINSGPPVVSKYYYEMKIKYFNSATTMDNFYNNIPGFGKISQCGLYAESNRFKFKIDINDEIEVAKVFPFLLNYYSCSPEQYLDKADSTCKLCPALTRTYDDQASCIAIKNSKYMVLSLISKSEIRTTGYSYLLNVYPTDDESDSVIKYAISPEPKILIDNHLRKLIKSSNDFSLDPTTGTTLYSYPFYPEFMTPIDGQAGSGECNSNYPFIIQNVLESEGKVKLEVRIGNNIADLHLCYVWFDKGDETRDASYTNFGRFIRNDNFDNTNEDQDHEAELLGIWNVKSTTLQTFMGPQSQFDDDFRNKPFPGDYYVTMDVKLDPAEFDLMDGLELDCSNSNYNPTQASITAAFGGDLIFHVTKHSDGFRVSCDTSGVYGAKDLTTGAAGTITASGLKWYTFKHSFKNIGGNLMVNMTVSDGNTVVVTCAQMNRNTIATRGGVRSYRFITIKKKVPTSRVVGVSQSQTIKIRNFKRVFESDANNTEIVANNNKCSSKYTRAYFCRATPNTTSPKILEYRQQYFKDANYQGYLPNYIAQNIYDLYRKDNGIGLG